MILLKAPVSILWVIMNETITIDEYLQNKEVNSIRYEQYVSILENYIVGDNSNLLEESFSFNIMKVFNVLKTDLNKVKDDWKLTSDEIMKIFSDPNIFQLLRSFGFSIRSIFRSLIAVGNLVEKGLLSIFKEISETKIVQKIRKGLIRVDDLIKKYPLLASLTGIALAGLLLWMWLNMTFIGDFDYDFNMSDIANAVTGKFSLADLFASQSGLMLITLFGSGVLLGVSIPWLVKSAYNLTIAIVYTGYQKLREKRPDIVTKMNQYLLKSKAIIKKSFK